jgi:hypothetical protein
MLILLSSTIKTFINATRSITFAYYNVFKSFIISNFELFKFNFKESLPSPYILIVAAYCPLVPTIDLKS